MASLKKVNKEIVEIKASFNILKDAFEEFETAFDTYKEELKAEAEAEATDKEND